MASHQLAIAKASFSAGLLRPDPTSVPRDEITAFHTSLDRALSHCSPANIQTCKSWLLEYVVSSSNRVGGWAKYLAALSGSLEAAPAAGRTSGKRRRLHILYLLNDVLHHTKYHLETSAAFSTLSGSLQPHVVELLGYAASYDREKNPKHHRRLDQLLDIWDRNGYYGSDYVNKLREVVKNSSVSGPVKTSLSVEESNVDLSAGVKQQSSGRDVPFVMPATHGDPSMPYYDLPAGNLVPHIIPDSTVPLRPESIKPLQFLAGPADENLVVALKKFMKDVDLIYGPGEPEHQEDEVVDVDDLGQVVIRDADGEVVDGDTYYGWSRSFCQQMKKRRARGETSRSRSRSHSHSRGSPKRRRYSDSESDWSSRSRSRSPRRSARRDSRTRSPSRPRSASRERSKSYSPRPPAPRSIPPPMPPAEYHPPPAHHHQHQHPPYGNAAPPPPPPVGYHPPPPPPMAFPPAGPGGAGAGAPHYPLPPGAVPNPPPPPPNYQGPWPPPPPPPMQNYGPPPAAHHAPHFPPPYGQQGGQYAQQMPPGSYHFPPPHSGGGGGRGWGYGNGRGWR
ncbi:RNA polymerase II-binding domain-containing protein [Aspergillus ibericus CBS 121593]|uniref:CID domain-containing protein n=1 Tax=Aspergillus ibericus CBS 121593 TaxID=1448316 RepID=A0A395H2N2_9EURO|nr:hypothetical protein BO80DRAFT_424299 [Aspergillus ibericus CBS 121593]RAL01923.1 hypothetical protein BO80DRAFT_424299 [Aspergillus ibericus CBS 121593]